MGLDNPLHIAFLLILLLLVFGAKRLPEMGRSLGDGMRGFRESLGGHANASPELTAPAEPALTATTADATQSVVPAATPHSAPQAFDERPAA